MNVFTDSRLSGGVAIIDKSLTSLIARLRVLGMGVAVIVNISILLFSDLSFSF